MIYKNMICKRISGNYTLKIQSRSFLLGAIYSACMKQQNIMPKSPDNKTVTPLISFLHFIQSTKACRSLLSGKKYCTNPRLYFLLLSYPDKWQFSSRIWCSWFALKNDTKQCNLSVSVTGNVEWVLTGEKEGYH